MGVLSIKVCFNLDDRPKTCHAARPVARPALQPGESHDPPRRGGRGVLLDLDGTLADTLADLTASVNHALAPFGFVAYTPEQVRPMVGDGLTKLIERAAPGASLHDRARMIERYRAFHGDHLLDHTRLYPGWESTLHALAQRGVPVCVLSNKPDAYTKTIVQRLLPRWTFVAVWGQRDGLPLKPDPAAALALCERMDRAPENVLCVGDSGGDMQMARRAGLIPVGATWGYRGASELREAGAACLIDSPGQLLELL